MGLREMEAGKRDPIQTFVFLDLEATGLKKDSPRIVELSMIAVSRHHLLEMSHNNNNNNDSIQNYNTTTAGNANFGPTAETGVDPFTHLAGNPYSATNTARTTNFGNIAQTTVAEAGMNSCLNLAATTVNTNFGAGNATKTTADLVNIAASSKTGANSCVTTKRNARMGGATNNARTGSSLVNIAANTSTVDARTSAANTEAKVCANLEGRANATTDTTKLNQTCPEMTDLNQTYLDATKLNQTTPSLNQGNRNSSTLDQTSPTTTKQNQTAMTTQSTRCIPALPRILHKYTRLYYPWKLVPPVVEQINGLNNESLEHLPGFTESSADAIGLFLDFPKPIVLIAHNGIAYDFPLLLAELIRVGRGDLLSGVRLCDSLSAIKDIDSVIEKEDVAEITKIAEEFCDFDLDFDLTSDLTSVPPKRLRSEDETDFVRHSQLDARTSSQISLTKNESEMKDHWDQGSSVSSQMERNISLHNQMKGNGSMLENALTAQTKHGNTAESKPSITQGVNVTSSITPQRTNTLISSNNPNFTSPDRARTQNRMLQTPTKSSVYRHPNTPPHTPTTPDRSYTNSPAEQGQQLKIPRTPSKFKPYSQPNTPPHTPITPQRRSITSASPHKQPTTPIRPTSKLASKPGQQHTPPAPVTTGHVINTTPPDISAHGSKNKPKQNVRRNLSQEYGRRKWSGVSYKQGCIYRRLFKASYPNHRAECDTEALLLICGHYGGKFVEWADTFAVDVTRVKPMWVKRSSFDTK